jgi:hypothetical protein
MFGKDYFPISLVGLALTTPNLCSPRLRLSAGFRLILPFTALFFEHRALQVLRMVVGLTGQFCEAKHVFGAQVGCVL